ncbi:MAG: type II toxin-antitoxin system RelE/ParE family toxin [Chloroflexota bacterium]
MYQLIIRPRAEKDLDHLPADIRRRVVGAISQLANDPRPKGCKKLFDGVYRIREGEYRVIYAIKDSEHIVDIGKITRRSENTYKDLNNLLHSTP